MKNRTLVLTAIVISLISTAVVSFIFFDLSAKGQQKPIKRYSEVPQIVSNIKTLEIVESNLREEGTTGAFVEIKIRNNSDKPIVAVSTESGNDKDVSGETVVGAVRKDDEQPSIIIQPYGTYQISFPISNVMPGSPIRIAGVIYADGGEDGDQTTLKSMRKDLERTKNKKTEDSPQ
ncbi:MAG: hypothetical protein ABWZ66_02455 [Pyrinomonadaceae bacterium]